MELRIEDERYERTDRGTIRALQFEKLTALLAKAWESNPFYRDHWQAAGVTPEDITSLEAFTARLPHIRKADLMADQEADPPFGRRSAHARAQGKQLMVFTTSGTTGQEVEVHSQTRAEWKRTPKVSN